MNSQRAYKDSGIEWIGEIPRDWEVVTLKRIFSFSKGLSITKADLIEKGVPVISYGQIHSKANKATSVDETLIRFVSHEYLYHSSQSLVGKNDFIFADTSEDLEGSGNYIYINENRKIFAGYHTIIAHPNKNEDYKYLAYLFLTDCWRSQIRSKVTGVKLFSISQKILREASVILPNKKNQTRIADFLDNKCSKIDSYINKQKQVIEKLKEYRQSIITEAVTKGLDKNAPMKDSGIEWIGKIPRDCRIISMKYLVKCKITDGTHLTPEYDDAETGSPFLSSKDIKNGYIDWSNIKYITQSLHEVLYAQTKPEKNDILLAKNGTTGIAALVDVDYIFDIYVTLALIKPNNKLVSAKYLLYFINSAISKNQFDEHLIGIGVPNLHLNVIENTKVLIHNIETQQQIVNYLDRKCSEIDNTINKKQTVIDKLTEYKKSLIYEVVTGKREV